jgi:dTDP-4-dehydrorhamnose reductase
MFNNILLTGSTGCVGTKLCKLLKRSYTVDTPMRSELNITDKRQVFSYITSRKPSVIVHCAASITTPKVEQERGNKHGSVWNTNVNGTLFIAEAAKQSGAFVIYISTGSVFSGTSNNPGPFKEEDRPTDDKDLSWYAITKKYAEQAVDEYAVVRLSHPVGGGKSAEGERFDYLERMIERFNNHTLYPLFDDVYFPVTYFPDLAVLIEKLIAKPKRGVYHPVSTTACSPYELFSKAIHVLGHDASAIPHISFSEFIKNQALPLQFSQYYGIDGMKTLHEWNLPKRTWEESIVCALEDNKVC